MNVFCQNKNRTHIMFFKTTRPLFLFLQKVVSPLELPKKEPRLDHKVMKAFNHQKKQTHIAWHRLHSIERIASSAQHTVHNIECIALSAQHRMHSIRCIAKSAQHRVHSIECIAQSAQHRALCIDCKIVMGVRSTVSAKTLFPIA